jgi:hypothetical protein
MQKVSTGFSMSLDGFIAGPNDDIQRLFAWMFVGNTDVKQSSGDTDLSLKVSSESAECLSRQPAGASWQDGGLFDVAGMGW